MIQQDRTFSSGLISITVHQVVDAVEVGAVAGIQIEPVGVGRGRDEQVRETTSRRAAFGEDRSDDETVTPRGRRIERNRLQLRLDLLQSDLPLRGLTRSWVPGLDRRPVRPR